MSNKKGDVIIGSTVCGASEYLNAAVTQVINGVAQTPILYTSYKAPYYAQEDWEHPPYARWGHYSRTSVDPDTGSFWTFQLCVPSPNAWGGQVAEVKTSR
jgi:hypothetical protein